MTVQFHVGQKVVCISDKWRTKDKRLLLKARLPVVGSVYTIREIFTFAGEAFVRLDEIVNKRYLTIFGRYEPAFGTMHFRPVVERKTSIAIFHEILNKTRTGVPA